MEEEALKVIEKGFYDLYNKFMEQIAGNPLMQAFGLDYKVLYVKALRNVGDQMEKGGPDGG